MLLFKNNALEKNKTKSVGKAIHPRRHLATQIAYQAAQTMNYPADIINVVIEELIHHRHELPTFDQLNRLVKHTRSLVNKKIFQNIFKQLDTGLIKTLDDLFFIKSGHSKTGYNNLKRLPKNPTITHFKELLAHHDWLMSFGSVENYLHGISKIKLQQFSANVKYKHIDCLFNDTIDWKLIETHSPDLMQVVLSIKAGKMSSSLLLRKLSNYSRKNRLYRAFQELGYVVRTQFLLEYISNVELRETITATTNKVEPYNQLCD